MSKVKITQEQADAIEGITDRESAAELQINGWKWYKNRCLNNLSFDDFIKALYIGYEVEPEFEVGDWVYRKSDGVVSKINRIENQEDFYGEFSTDKHRGWLYVEEIRHATPEEIEKEKERRWWAKHNRDV